MGGPFFLQMKIQVIALKDHEWKAKPRKADETYEIDTDDPRFNAAVQLGLVRLPNHPEVETRAIDNPVDPQSGKYKRRDMRAKE